MSELLLRRGRPEDAAFLTTAVMASGEQNMRFLLSREPKGYLKKWVRSKTGLFSHRYFWLIEKDNVPVACCSILRPEQTSTAVLNTWWQMRPYTIAGLKMIRRLSMMSTAMAIPDVPASMISSVYVPAAHRGQGYATRLLSALIQKYRGAIALQVAISNKAAINLYEQTGFKSVGLSEPSSVVEQHYLMLST